MTVNLKVGFSVAHATRISGGISEVLRCLGGAMIEKRAEVRIFAGEDKYLPAGTTHWEGIETSIFKTLPPHQFGYQVGLRQAVEAWSADVIHIHGLWMYPSWATRHWRQMGLPYVVAPHGMIDSWALNNSARKKRLAYALFERASLEGAACLHALNEMELAAIRDAGISRPVAVLANGTELPQNTTKTETSEKILLYLGRLHPKKGLAELLMAFAQVRNKASGWKLVVAGWDDGGYLETLERLREELGLSNVVEFTGPVFGEIKEDLFKKATAFILPSKSEGMPMAVLEAWSHNLPVLMTPECNLQHAFGEGAALSITSEPDVLAKELSSFLAMPDLVRREIGAKGYGLVRSRYQWSTIAEQAMELHSWVAGLSAPPDFVEVMK